MATFIPSRERNELLRWATFVPIRIVVGASLEVAAIETILLELNEVFEAADSEAIRNFERDYDDRYELKRDVNSFHRSYDIGTALREPRVFINSIRSGSTILEGVVMVLGGSALTALAAVLKGVWDRSSTKDTIEGAAARAIDTTIQSALGKIKERGLRASSLEATKVEGSVRGVVINFKERAKELRDKKK